ncbi:MAG: hypothetical protein OEN51_00005, partial [Gammaproteobacteria bacterium]|nr:hypothetical protein [Gammaproteobacteria bacterium]
NERGRVEPGPNPFTPDKVLTMCPEKGVNHVTGIHLGLNGAPGEIRTPDRLVRSQQARCNLLKNKADKTALVA